MKLLGEVVENQNILDEVLDSSERFLHELFAKITFAHILDISYNEKGKIPETDYYLIYNRFAIVGKKKIDKRIIRKISRREIIEELDMNWFPGLEPNFILIPLDSSFSFGIYIQDSIYYLDRSIISQ